MGLRSTDFQVLAPSTKSFIRALFTRNPTRRLTSELTLWYRFAAPIKHDPRGYVGKL